MDFASLVYFCSMKNLVYHISDLLNESIKSYKPISGGDISKAFLLETSHASYFLKVNSCDYALTMFEAEKSGLEAIGGTNTIAVPQIFHLGQFEKLAFLLLEFIPSKSASKRDSERLGYELATLHKVTSNQFGFQTDNFIGSLPQSNQQYENWTDFYVEERLVLQLELAATKNLMATNEIPEKGLMKNILQGLFKNIKPSLLHGDLWSGNFLIAQNGTPYVIDPSTYYGHCEVDIAMSKLFGGFGSSFYNAYHEIHSQTSETTARIEIYQLYYLLVHLNLFGHSYYNGVKRILTKFFK